jgi:hypothetical protein
MNRWYDKHRKLGKLLDSFKTIKKYRREKLCEGIIDLMKEHDGEIIDNMATEFPLELPHRRWYDKDPYLWLIVNGLRLADKKLITKVTRYLETHIE